MIRRTLQTCTLLLIAGIPLNAEPPDFKIGPVPGGRLKVFQKQFNQHTNVFGIHLFGSPGTPPGKLRHAAIIMAEYLDNDEDGHPDNPKVVRTLVEQEAFLFMTATERGLERLDHEVFQSAGFHRGQGQFATETNPGRGRFDATLEEVLHLITNVGYAETYPKVFGERPGTTLGKCLDRARGGHFRRVPRRYPKEAWFTYDDRSCDYGCQCTEYLYWAITSILGAQENPRRREEIAHEWRLYNRELVRTRDPEIYKLITNPEYKLPKKLPDGKYSPGKSKSSLFTPDLDLIKPLTPEDHRRLGQGRAPFFAQHKKDGRELVFLGTRHDVRLDSPSHRLIEEVITGFSPDCIIIEGFGTHEGSSPSRLLQDARRKVRNGACPEPLYAAVLAADRNIPFIGGEPPASATVNALRSLGSDRDALGWLVVRGLGQARREEGPGALNEKVSRMLPGLKRRFKLEAEMDLNDFKAWFEDRSGKPFNPTGPDAGRVAPMSGPNAKLLQRMAVQVMLAREKHLVSLEAKMLEQYRKVLVVYGAGHLIYEMAVLNHMMGEPVRIARAW